jgi:hypothetical protein
VQRREHLVTYPLSGNQAPIHEEPTAGFVGQDEVAFPAIVAMLLAKTSRAE